MGDRRGPHLWQGEMVACLDTMHTAWSLKLERTAGKLLGVLHEQDQVDLCPSDPSVGYI